MAGYDRTPTPLTETLIAEGAQIHYEEKIELIPEACKDKGSTLVVFTPAVQMCIRDSPYTDKICCLTKHISPLIKTYQSYIIFKQIDI